MATKETSLDLTPSDLSILEELGLPEESAKELAKLPGVSSRTYNISRFLFIFMMVVLFAATTSLSFPWFADLLIALGYIPKDVLLVELNFVSGVIFVFADIFAAGLVLGALYALVPRFNRRYMITTLKKLVDGSEPYGWANLWLAKQMIRQVVRGESRDVLKKFIQVQFRLCVGGVFWLYATASAFLWWDVRSITWATPEGISISPYFSKERTFHAWEDATLLTTGCNRLSDSPLHYQVYFTESVTRDLSKSTYIIFGDSHLAVLDEIDGKLRQAGVPWKPGYFEGGLYDGGSLWNPACFAKARNQYPEDEHERFNRVYHLDEAENPDRLFFDKAPTDQSTNSR